METAYRVAPCMGEWIEIDLSNKTKFYIQIGRISQISVESR